MREFFPWKKRGRLRTMCTFSTSEHHLFTASSLVWRGVTECPALIKNNLGYQRFCALLLESWFLKPRSGSILNCPNNCVVVEHLPSKGAFRDNYTKTPLPEKRFSSLSKTLGARKVLVSNGLTNKTILEKSTCHDHSVAIFCPSVSFPFWIKNAWISCCRHTEKLQKTQTTWD